MCFECFLYPVYVGHVLFVGVVMRIWHIVYSRSVYLIPYAVDQPFFSFPGAPLYYNKVWCVFPFKIFFCCAYNSVVATGTFSVTYKVIVNAFCKFFAPTVC